MPEDFVDTVDLQWFEARQSDDELKQDLELTCIKCGEDLCDVEHGDSLQTLVNMTRDHVCAKTGAME